jgi:iron(III)-salmochelin esterase
MPPLSTPSAGAHSVKVSAAGDAALSPTNGDASGLARSDGALPASTAIDKNAVLSSRSRLRLAMQEQTWTFQDANFGRIDVVVVLPDRFAEERFPLLIALHGRGEAMKGPERGARGWVDDYALMRAMQRLGKPPLGPNDFVGIVTPKRLETLNQALQREPYRGLVVLCPYTPDLLAGDKPFEYARPYSKFLVEVLLPRARRELPVTGTAETTGIDGVSLGGRVGFLSGLYAAEEFHTVAGLQAAFDSEDAVALGRLGDDAYRRNRGIRFRLLTSDRDYFVEANQTIAAEFQRRRLPMHLLLVPGPHDYVFNRGPGSIEMLFFHDRALRRPAWPE